MDILILKSHSVFLVIPIFNPVSCIYSCNSFLKESFFKDWGSVFIDFKMIMYKKEYFKLHVAETLMFLTNEVCLKQQMVLERQDSRKF